MENKNISNKYKIKKNMKSRYYFDNHNIDWACCYTVLNKKTNSEFPLLKVSKEHINFNQFVKSNDNNSYSPIAWGDKYTTSKNYYSPKNKKYKNEYLTFYTDFKKTGYVILDMDDEDYQKKNVTKISTIATHTPIFK